MCGCMYERNSLASNQDPAFIDRFDLQPWFLNPTTEISIFAGISACVSSVVEHSRWVYFNKMLLFLFLTRPSLCRLAFQSGLLNLVARVSIFGRQWGWYAASESVTLFQITKNCCCVVLILRPDLRTSNPGHQHSLWTFKILSAIHILAFYWSDAHSINFEDTSFERTMDVPSTPKACIIKAESTPHKDSSGDSLTNTTEDLNHRLAGEMSGRLIENVPLDDFMGKFLKSSEYKDAVAPSVLY